MNQPVKDYAFEHKLSCFSLYFSKQTFKNLFRSFEEEDELECESMYVDINTSPTECLDTAHCLEYEDDTSSQVWRLFSHIFKVFCFEVKYDLKGFI